MVIPLAKKGNHRQCQNYRKINMICHPSKVLLHIILNHLKSKAEELLSEEQASFRIGRNTMEQFFNCLIEKYLQHQKDVFHNFVDFKKVFDHIWHDGLWQILREFNVDNRITQVIQALHKDATNAVLLGKQMGGFFQTTVIMRQGCVLSLTLINLFLDRIMQETLNDHEPSIYQW